MRTFVTTPFVLFLAFGSAAAQTQSVSEFRTGDISMRTTLKEFKKLYPEAKPTKHEDAEYGVRAFTYTPEGADGLRVAFVGEEMYEIAIVWKDRAARAALGEPVIGDRLVAKYGKVSAQSPGVVSDQPFVATYIWTSSNDSVAMMLQYKGVCAVVVAMNMDRCYEIRAKKKATGGQ